MLIITSISLAVNFLLLIISLILFMKVNKIQNKLTMIEENINLNTLDNIEETNNKINNDFNFSIQAEKNNLNLVEGSEEDEDISQILLENSYKEENRITNISDEVIDNILRHSNVKVEREKLKKLLEKGELETAARILKLTLTELKILL